MIDSETGMPFTWPSPGGGNQTTPPNQVASSQPLYSPAPGGGTASSQPLYSPVPAGMATPAGGSGTLIGQQPNATGGMSPLLQYLMGGGGQGGGMSPLLMMLLQGGGVASSQPLSSPPPAGFSQQPNGVAIGQQPGVPSMGANGAILPQIAQYLMGQQAAAMPQPTANQQSWMSQMGWGNDLSKLTAMQRGGLNTALSATDPSNPDYLANAQYNTPQEFVSGWNQLFGG